MGSEALETLPVVRCPGCREPMEPKCSVPVTMGLDDISYACPKCGAETKRTIKRAG
jgi:DNA-directed RNA polymerase subunit RPC12/RpoP